MPSTACPWVLNAIETVTYSGRSTVTAQRTRTVVAGQLTRSTVELDFVGRLPGLGGHAIRLIHHSAFRPRVSESWRREIRMATTKKMVALAIW